MLKDLMVKSVLIALACSVSFIAHAMADSPKPIDIPAGNLVPALEALEKQAAVELVYRAEQLKDLRTAGVKGTYTAHDAVKLLLKGTPLELRTDPSGAMLIAPPQAHSATSSSRESATDAAEKEGKTDSSAAFRVAQATAGQGTGASSLDSESKQAGKGELSLQEIVVTAQKKTENLLSVPVPVTAVSAQQLLDNNLSRLQDYYNQVPGLVVTPSVNGLTSLTIRGITSGGLTNPTVGVTIDDVPFGTTNITAGGLLVPDLDPGDLERVEVLRGPQGTLYGANSLGGLFKYVTVDPSTDGVSGRVEAGLSGVYNGNEPGYNVRGSTNVPISDTVAFRVSGFHRTDPGYINDVQTGQNAVNQTDADGGHLSILFKPSDDFSVKLGALIQATKLYGAPDADVPTAGYPQTANLGDLQQTRVAGSGWMNDTAQLYSAIVHGKFGAVDLISVTGYGLNSESNSLDYSYLVGPIMKGLFNVPSGVLLNHYFTTKVSEELRATMPLGEHVEWLLGGFFTSERTHLFQNIAGVEPSSGGVVGSWSATDIYLRYREASAFTDFTVHFTDRFDVQFGGRESHIEVPFGAAAETGPRFGGGTTVPPNESTANAFTYLVTPEFIITPNLMAYARLASGYRPGAPNTGAGVAAGVLPGSYAPDKTRNYELGLKGDLLDHRLSLDASLYYIDWKDIQVFLISQQTLQSYVGNAGAAKSEGFELSSQLRPLDSLTLSGWISYNLADLTQGFPTTSTIAGGPGSPLPTAPKWSGNVSADLHHALTDRWTGFIGGTFSYVGERSGAFLRAGQMRAIFPSYPEVNLNAGLRNTSWTGTLYVNNVADKRGVLNGGGGYFPPFAEVYIVPRTVGLTLTKEF